MGEAEDTRTGAMADHASSPMNSYRTRGSPLFQEWIRLAHAGPVSYTPAQIERIGKGDALLVIDMQKDFVPCSQTRNSNGGRFGVPEGDHIIYPINQLISCAAENGATVVATRDYHPEDHVSFMSQGGPFPEHCVQGTPGAELMPSIAVSLQVAWQKDPSKVIVAFKAFHEDVDSFGALPYAKNGPGRLCLRAPGQDQSTRCPMGCHACAWRVIWAQSCATAASIGHEPAWHSTPVVDLRG